MLIKWSNPEVNCHLFRAPKTMKSVKNIEQGQQHTLIIIWHKHTPIIICYLLCHVLYNIL